MIYLHGTFLQSSSIINLQEYELTPWSWASQGSIDHFYFTDRKSRLSLKSRRLLCGTSTREYPSHTCYQKKHIQTKQGKKCGDSTQHLSTEEGWMPWLRVQLFRNMQVGQGLEDCDYMSKSCNEGLTIHCTVGRGWSYTFISKRFTCACRVTAVTRCGEIMQRQRFIILRYVTFISRLW